MITEEHCAEKTCLFCASDFHLEMILLPYIKERINKDEIIIFTEKSLEESLNILLERINLNKEDKEKIKKINWKNIDEIKFKQIRKNKNKNFYIIVNGNYNYIKKINKKINELINSKIEIVDCYHIGDTNITNISKNYKNILNTKMLNN